MTVPELLRKVEQGHDVERPRPNLAHGSGIAGTVRSGVMLMALGSQVLVHLQVRQRRVALPDPHARPGTIALRMLHVGATV